MEYLVSTATLPYRRLETLFHVANRAGADGLELVLPTGLDAIDTAAIKRLERAYEVPIRSVHVPLRVRQPSPDRLAQDIVQSARIASDLPSCTVLVTHAPGVRNLHEPAAHDWLRALEQARSIVDSKQMVITVENAGKPTATSRTHFLDHPERLRWLAEEWALGITFDCAHAASCNWEISETVDYLLRHVHNVHLSDRASGPSRSALWTALLYDHRSPGTGSLPLRRFLRRLRYSGYHGLITLELSPVAAHAWRTTTTTAIMREALAFCRREAQPVDRPSAADQSPTDPNRLPREGSA